MLYAITTIVFILIYAGSSFTLVKPKFDRTLLRPLLAEGIWFGLQGVIMTIYFEIDKLMMRLFQITGWVEMADGDIARYGAAARIVIFFLIFHRIGLQVITPYLYAAYRNNLDRYKRIVRFSTRYMSAIGIGLGIGIITMAPEIVQVIYGGKFAGIEPALQLFGLFFVIRFIGITSSQIFATTGNQPKRTKQEGMGVVLNIVLDCICIPLFGYMGGAIATVVTESVMQGAFFVMTRRLIKDGVFSSLLQIFPALVAGGVMGVGVWYSKAALPVWLTPILGALAYAVLLYLFRFFTPADLKLLKKQSSEAIT
jgi:O-antigen/teichoic acid export membrane protein